MKKILGYIIIILIGVYIAVAIIDDILLDLSPKKQYDPAKMEKTEYMMLEPSSLCVDNNKIYVFCNRYSKMNVYDKESGNFLYSRSFPNATKGAGYIYIIDGNLCVMTKDSDIYQYKNDKLIGSLEYGILYDADHKKRVKYSEKQDEFAFYIEDMEKGKILMADNREFDKICTNFDNATNYTDELGESYTVKGLCPKVIRKSDRKILLYGKHRYAQLFISNTIRGYLIIGLVVIAFLLNISDKILYLQKKIFKIR